MYGYELCNRTTTSIEFKEKDIEGELTEKFELLCVIPFKSESRKMRVIVKTNENKIFLLSKGAESEICKLVSENESQWLSYNTTAISKIGLRTLGFC
mmetsp:Transcript_105744/g.227929  ORF Transcript_105744/g.227929 Transcript_105744/m.227929 type:complete len:97 (+) Transcript_105744:429-719(+)